MTTLLFNVPSLVALSFIRLKSLVHITHGVVCSASVIIPLVQSVMFFQLTRHVICTSMRADDSLSRDLELISLNKMD